jgi:hypothetical protein
MIGKIQNKQTKCLYYHFIWSSSVIFRERLFFLQDSVLLTKRRMIVLSPCINNYNWIMFSNHQHTLWWPFSINWKHTSKINMLPSPFILSFGNRNETTFTVSFPEIPQRSTDYYLCVILFLIPFTERKGYTAFKSWAWNA